jgi:hypothetical protein
MPKNSKKGKNGTIDTIDPIIHMKKTVRTILNRYSRGSHKISIIYYVISALVTQYPDMISIGVKYAIKEKNMEITFFDLMNYIYEYFHKPKTNEVIEKIISTMVITYDINWLSPNPLETIIEYATNTSRKSCLVFYDLIMYIIRCDLCETPPKIIDEIIKSTQQAVFIWHNSEPVYPPIDKLQKCVYEYCNIYGENGYIDFLEKEKSEGLTQWFSPPNGHQQGDRLEHWDLQKAQWTTRLVIASNHMSSIDEFTRIFNMMITLASNNLKFSNSMTFKIGFRQIIINYAKKFDTIHQLYNLIVFVPQQVGKNTDLTNSRNSIYGDYIFDGLHLIPRICQRMLDYEKQLMYFQIIVLSKLKMIFRYDKYIGINIMEYIYPYRYHLAKLCF